MANDLAKWVTVNGTNPSMPFCTRIMTALPIYTDYFVGKNIHNLPPLVSMQKCSCTISLQDRNLHIPGLDLGLEVQSRK